MKKNKMRKGDCLPPNQWVVGKGCFERVGGARAAQVAPPVVGGQKVRKLKRDCLPPQYNWIVGQGCFENAAAAVAPAPAAAPVIAVHQPLGKKVRLGKGYCIEPVYKWVVGKGCFQAVGADVDAGGGAAPVPKAGYKAAAKRFTVITELGSGSYGVVYEVREESTGKIFAAKTFVSGVDWNEINILFSVEHPNILHAVDLYLDKKKGMWVILPLGQDMHKWVQNNGRNISLDNLADWWYKMLSGVAYLHSLGNYHCDIKPGNTLIVNNEPVIADFGMSYSQEDDVTSVCGTPSWTPPNNDSKVVNWIKKNKTAKISMNGLDEPVAKFNEPALFVKSDIYSLGMIFLWMIDSNPVNKAYNKMFKAATGEQILATMVRVPAFIDKLGMPTDLKDVLKAMTQPIQSQRINSIDEVLKMPFFASRGMSSPIPGRLYLGNLSLADPNKQALDKLISLAGDKKFLRDKLLAVSASCVARAWGTGIFSGKDRIEKTLAACITLCASALGLPHDAHFNPWIVYGTIAGESPDPEDWEKLAVALEGVILTPTVQTLGASRAEILWWIKGLIDKKWNLTQESLKDAHARYMRGER
jgi:serine/threonine protein kinase